MTHDLLRSWWSYSLRGVLLFLFGAVCLLAPGITVSLLAVWAGAFILVDGVFGLIGVLSNWRAYEEKWLLLVEAVLNILIGILVLRMPEAMVWAFVLLMAAWAVLVGITRIAVAVQLRKEIKGEGWIIASGVLTVLFGALLAAMPSAGVITLAWLIGFPSIIIGVVLVAMSFRMRKLQRSVSAK